MSDVKYTPGPWSVLSDRNGCLRIGHGTNCTIASVYEPPFGFMEANARLIAAAPDLLEALVQAVACRMVPISSAREGGACAFARHAVVADMIRDAIAKATQP